MKTLISALTLIALIAGPAFVNPASARTDVDQFGPANSGTYHGYPLEEWYKHRDSW